MKPELRNSKESNRIGSTQKTHKTFYGFIKRIKRAADEHIGTNKIQGYWQPGRQRYNKTKKD